MWEKYNINPNDDVEITIYGSVHKYTREKALDFFYECMLMSEGSERDRYVNVIAELMAGKTIIKE